MKRILVADDSVTIQKVITLTFADEPFEVQSVGTGAEALELVKSWKPDIVLADVIMPQMNGYELCRAVKQQAETSSTPVLLLAGTFEAFDEGEAKSVGADDFITKPFESAELIEKVKKLVGPGAAAPAVEEAPGVPVVAGAEEPPAQPVAVPQAAPPTAAVESAEPDIWDILSDSGDQPQADAVNSSAPGPGFGPIEDAGVVDVGSFDVGLGRPESPPPPPVPSEPAPPEAVQMTDEAVEPAESVIQPAVQAPEAVDPLQGTEEKSQVEDREKDFFGFETGAVEEVPAADFLEDAVEEVTFEMEQPAAAPEAAPQEVSFVVPEPAEGQPVVTGETISPEFLAPEPAAPEPIFEPAPESQEAEPVPGPELAQGEVPVPVSEPMPAPVPEPAPEPPLELSVDLTPELPEGFSPEPVEKEVVQTPVQPAPEPVLDIPQMPADEPPQAAPSQDVTGVPDDAAIRKMVEEKVEKIVWEVVPEMAEVIIREAIQKIKDGT